MLLRTAFLSILSGSIFALFASSAVAQCTCEKEDRHASLNASDIVFWGKASANDDGALVFRVSKSFKGTRRKRKHTVVPTGACDAKLEADERYMVFATKAKEGKKRSINVSACSATTALPKSPYAATTWSNADELPYGVGKRTVRRHARDRDRLTDRASDKVRYAARKCDEVWKGKDEADLRIEVRFDVQPNGSYEATVTDYQGTDDPEIDACLAKRLDGKKFRKFSGNAVSVRAYWQLNRIDASMKQEKRRAVVIQYEGKLPEKKKEAKAAK